MVFRAVSRVCFRARTTGTEHIPKDGGLLIAANHASFLDIPLLGSCIPRRVAFLGRQDLFPIPGLNPLLQWLGWIPIRHDRLDRTGFGRAMELINEGKAVVIYPEGTRTRTGSLGPGKPGLGTIVAETRCSVLPAYIGGTFEALPMGSSRLRFRPVWVAFGKPIDFSADLSRYGKKEFYRHVSQTVMDRIADLGHAGPPAG
jgi:1-acyl-sn-glycerol-3-phosphate acyltransferase